MEQGILTDQDNALIIADDADEKAFEPMMMALNQKLDNCCC